MSYAVSTQSPVHIKLRTRERERERGGRERGGGGGREGHTWDTALLTCITVKCLEV
jgi:hypothetical protein